jgi:hypothetical protein
MSSLSNLKKGSSLDKLKSAIKNQGTQFKQDERFWYPEQDKAGNAYAVIRFLDAPKVDGDDGLPFVHLFSHGFQGPGGWYIENSLTTLGQNDPVSEYNSKLWNSGVEANKEIARKQKRRLTYIANILVVEDSAHPENNGQIKLFKFGKKIFDKIQEKLEPQFKDEKSVNVFNFWEGANFKLKIRKVEGYVNYDKSEFEAPSPVAGSDKEIEKIWENEHSLKAFIAPDQFKSYDQLKARLDKVLGITTSAVSDAPAATEQAEPIEEEVPFVPGKTVELPAATKPRATAETVATADDEDDDLFKRLANDD